LPAEKGLILDDDELICSLLREILKNEGFSIAVSSTYRDAQDQCQQQKFDLLFLDYHLPEGIGWTLANEVTGAPKTYGSPLFVLMSGTADLSEMSISEKFVERVFFIKKPFDLAELETRIDKLFPR